MPQPAPQPYPNQSQNGPQPNQYNNWYGQHNQYSQRGPQNPYLTTLYPAAPAPTPTAAAIQTQPKRKFGWIIAVIAAVLAVVLAVTVTLVLRRNDSAPSAKDSAPSAKDIEEIYGTTLTSEHYDLQKPMLNVANSKDFTMHVTSKAIDGVAKSTTINGCSFFCVYTDPTLSMPAMVSHTFDRKHETLRMHGVSQPDGSTDSWLSSDVSMNLGFSGFPAYWLVQWRDENGGKLAKPRVTYFTVKDSQRADVATPQNLVLAVEEDGVLRISWDKVSGAKGYRLHVFQQNTAHDLMLDKVLVDTDKTSIRMDEFDDIKKCGGLGQKECTVDDRSSTRNGSLGSLVSQSEDGAMHCKASKELDLDEAYCSDYDLKELYGGDQELADKFMTQFDPQMDVSNGWIGVTALDDDNHESYVAAKSLEPLKSSIVIGEATWTNRKIDSIVKIGTPWGTLNDETKRMRAKYYVTMLDGYVHEIYEDCSQDTLKDSSLQEYECKVPGTWFTNLRFFQDEGDYHQYSQQVAAFKRSEPKTGLANSALVKAVGEAKAIDSKPLGQNGVEKYKPFGSTPYVRYVAENMLAMHESIDVSEYASSPSAPTIDMVVEEALGQNAYLYAMRGAGADGMRFDCRNDGDRSVLVVEYAENAKTRRDELYTAVMDAAEEINADNDADRVKQIENLLAARAEYDYEAFDDSKQLGYVEAVTRHPRSWGGGVLLDGKGVCASYATCFDAIADQVGLTSLTVIGFVESKDAMSHMWNRVQIDGTWMDTDPTWDDDGDHAGSAYQLKRANGLDLHDTFASGGWMLASSMAAYGGSGE
ncbi:hypothetical protein D2E22_1346 [Bifidobacterium castoris]|uniref:Transglutaminase-like domain-containing protein n=2 Tax=Bifidobacterium castoris TaxID=2306972 RepID=A0A430F615_9BIFI|nr:hypothetical protein D2E22_1346 [Bifidobacterium castoris]